MQRQNAAWKETLRRDPGEPVETLESLKGLRRITLNNNPLLEDRGLGIIADALRYRSVPPTPHTTPHSTTRLHLLTGL